MPGKRELLDAVAAHDGVATRRELVQRVGIAAFDAGVRRGWLRRLQPRVYAAATTSVTDEVRARAALRYAREGAALSHVSALRWCGGNSLGGVLHVTVDHRRKLAGGPALVVHRRRGFNESVPRCRVVRGVLVTDPARTVVDAWPLLPARDRRPAALDMVRSGWTTGAALGVALGGRSNVPGHEELRRTVDLIEDGVRSELEAVGVLSIFRHPDLPVSEGQRRVEVEGQRFYLDRCWPEAGLAVELDGARHHTSPEARQRDLRRDRLLAAAGWLVLRFTYADVVRDPEGVRQQVLAVYRARIATCRVA